MASENLAYVLTFYRKFSIFCCVFEKKIQLATKHFIGQYNKIPAVFIEQNVVIIFVLKNPYDMDHIIRTIHSLNAKSKEFKST